MKRTLDQWHLSNLQRISRMIGFANMSLGVLVLLGWRFQWREVTQISSRFPEMTPNTAVAIILLGVVLYWDINRRPPVPRSIASITIGVILFTIGTSALFEHIFPQYRVSLNHALSDWLATPMKGNGGQPPFPAASTSVCLLSFAVSLIMMRSRPFLAQLLLLPAALIPFAELITETYHLPLLPGFFGGSSAPDMAAHTAIALFFSAFGFLASYPKGALVWRLLDKSPAGEAFRVLSLALLCVPVIFAVSSIAMEWLPEGNELLVYTLLLIILVSGFLFATATLIRKLERSEGRFYQLMDQAGDGIFVADMNGVYTEVNRAACEMLGYSADELIGKKILDLLDPHDWPLLDSVRFQLLQPGGSHMGEWNLRHKDGHMVPTEINAKILPNGGPWQAIVRDISDRKQMVDQLRFLSDSAHELSEFPSYQDRIQKIASLLVPKLSDFCMVFSKEGNEIEIETVAHADPEKCELLRRTGREFPPFLTSLIGSGAETSPKLEIVEKVTHETYLKFAQSELHLQRLKEIGVLSYASAPLVAHGRVIGIIFLGMVNETRSYRQRDFDFLSQVINRFSIALDNARLYSEAVAAVRSREDVLAIVSHDLKNPLATIDLASQLAMMKADAGLSVNDIKEYISTIRHTNQRMKRLVDMLLNVGKLQAGTFVANRKDMSLGALFKDTEEVFAPQAKRKSIELHFQAPEDDRLEGDFGALSQAVSNLVNNALKFSPPHTKVEIEGKIGPQNEVVISVSDQGQGIPTEAQHKIFDRYWQPEKSRKEGAGLGLFIVKGVAEAHDGTVSVASSPGKGSTFTIHLTRKVRAEEPARRRAATGPKDAYLAEKQETQTNVNL